MIAAQDFDDPAGTVEVRLIVEDGTNNYHLEVTFTTQYGWLLDEVQVHVGSSLDDFPLTKKGSPKIGQFTYSAHDIDDDTYTFYNIPIPSGADPTDLDHGDILIGAHAVVYRGLGTVDYESETGWGRGPQWTENNWGMYIKFPCLKSPTFATDDLRMYFKHWGAESYWDVTFSGLASGNTLVDGTYVGWCVDKDHTMGQGWHTADIKSTYDLVDDIEWDKINWIINHRDGYSRQEVQDAIWHYTDDLTVSGDAAALVSDADTYGEGFRPSKGQMMAIYIETPQKNIFELDP